MIIPVRCFTCNTILADKYDWFIREVRKQTNEDEPNILDVSAKDIKKTPHGLLLDKLGLKKYLTALTRFFCLIAVVRLNNTSFFTQILSDLDFFSYKIKGKSTGNQLKPLSRVTTTV